MSHRTVVLLFAALALSAACDNGPRSSTPAATPAPETLPTPPDVAAPPADAIKTPSGLASKVLAPGTGTQHPRPNSLITVHYSGWTTDGKLFDSSVGKEPLSIGLDRVIRGWTEGVQMMVPGEKRRFWIPEALAYEGQAGSPQGMLVFDIELIRIDS